MDIHAFAEEINQLQIPNLSCKMQDGKAGMRLEIDHEFSSNAIASELTFSLRYFTNHQIPFTHTHGSNVRISANIPAEGDFDGKKTLDIIKSNQQPIQTFIEKAITLDNDRKAGIPYAIAQVPDESPPTWKNRLSEKTPSQQEKPLTKKYPPYIPRQQKSLGPAPRKSDITYEQFLEERKAQPPQPGSDGKQL